MITHKLMKRHLQLSLLKPLIVIFVEAAVKYENC